MHVDIVAHDPHVEAVTTFSLTYLLLLLLGERRLTRPRQIRPDQRQQAAHARNKAPGRNELPCAHPRPALHPFSTRRGRPSQLLLINNAAALNQ
eukprot:2829257-Pyramimonas_sp.AAC.2